ncbi:CTL-like protein [Phytophthora citrophthora]|uniref:Choline transporter-like protein n=1 Tax=Phytophthora citrophthora TaxID=4793 RepID=A0AAD9GM61_9STRA|nr:CTL-like protein [Phytophthora citrophthora]
MELDRADEEVLLEKVPQQLPAGQRDERKDYFFAVAFAANCAAVSFIAVRLLGWKHFLIRCLLTQGDSLSFVDNLQLFFGLPNVSSIYFTVHREDDSSHGLKIFLIFLATSCIGGGVSALWLQVLQNHAERVISWTLKASIVAFIVASLAAFYDSGMAGKAIGFINLFFALTIVTYYASVRRSIAFAASNLTAASRILRVFPGVIMSAYMALLAQAAWVMIWGAAVVGVLAKAVDPLHDSSSYGNTCFFFLLLSFYWFVQVAKNVVHCITAGSVGEWWFGAQDANTIQRAQTRALTTSLGSICIGSLVVAALNALHTLLLSTPRRKAKGSANVFLEFLVKLVMRNMQYFNKYAFCQVALYGKDFRLAGTDTMHLFRDRGWTALLNDSLISSVLSVGCLVVGTVSGVIGSAWLYLTLRCTADEMAEHPGECQTFNVVLLTFVACASIGYAMCTIMSSILDSIVATIFVCFAEVRFRVKHRVNLLDPTWRCWRRTVARRSISQTMNPTRIHLDPAALQRSHPDEHARLVEAWSRLQPDLLSFPTHMV